FSGTQSGFVWEDDDFRDFLKRDVAGTVFEFGPRSTPGFKGAKPLGLGGWELEFVGWNTVFPLPGRHNLLDALAAVSVAMKLGAGSEALASGLASVKPLFGRSQLFGGRISLLQDCYNANPESSRALLDLVDSLEWPGKKIYVLGSMRELGEESRAEHRALGARARKSKADKLFFFGEEMAEALLGWEEAGGARRSPPLHTEDMALLQKAVLAALEPGDLLVLKASRGLELERLSNAVFDAGWAELPGGEQGGSHAS
ncbi:MAG TPA: cyanophycin synthetase, partial [Rectinemataceae bacterium]